jgi:pyridoxal phosphate enzyme (YggS family)
MTRAGEIAANLAQVHTRLQRAEQTARRPAGSVRLVAVSKTRPFSEVLMALEAGQTDFGENYAQELRDKRAAVEAQLPGSAPKPLWHFIGPVQSNKMKYLAGKVGFIHTLDAPELLEEAERRLHVAAGTQACLVQVNVAGEPQKRGVTPARLPALLDRFAALPHLRCVGLMLIPPLTENPEDARAHFAALRRLRETESRQARTNVDLRELSMGMSHDLEVAVSEGSTLVRVGTAIFGPRSTGP